MRWFAHVFAQPGDELESLFKEQFGQGSGNVAAIPEQLATKSFDHARNRSPIINVAWSQTTSQQIPSVIDRQVQFKSEEPAHARFATSGVSRKDAVSTDPLGMTDFQRSRIDEADPCTGPKTALQIGKQWQHHTRDQSHKARITHQMRKFTGQMNLNMLHVIGFERSIVGLMKMDQNGHHLAWAELARTLSLLASLQLAGFPMRLKAQEKVIDITEQFE